MQILLSALLLAVGCCFALACFNFKILGRWRNMTWLYGLALLLSISFAGISLYSQQHPFLWFNPSIITTLLIPLVSFLALVLTRYARTYLEGQPRIHYFQQWFALCLLSVWAVLSSNHMAVFISAWVAISFCFHRLLMMFPERPRAALAAHKKFIFARIAELSLFTAFLLLYAHWQSPWISQWTANIGQLDALPRPLVFASVLVVITAMIKCAQLPIHGWLIQVVESPTPVSALLHAGIVNLGGFLVIVFAPLISLSPMAIWTLLIWAGLSVVIAALVVQTRISIKVKLAWSTSAQMGFMLLECALGYYELAILHLLAHSLYKAYAFLASSSEVDKYLLRQINGSNTPSFKQIAASLLLGTASVALWHSILPIHPAMSVLYIIMFSLLFSHLFKTAYWYLSIPLSASVFVVFYVVQQMAINHFISAAPVDLSMGQLVWVSLLFIIMGSVYWLLKLAAKRPLSQRVYRWLYAGFYLDEWSTRLTLAIWPTQLPKKHVVSTTPYTQERSK
ncbi:MAG: NADH-quinone oxidoreductase subunit L [Paraglaciecola sp.]|nr:NADH-quinone oxidoreductase subunit L [Paraglaciecola sp.]